MAALFQLASLAWAVGVTLPALLLLGVAATWEGRLLALACVFIGAGPAAALFARQGGKRRRGVFAFALGIAGFAWMGGAWMRLPKPPAGARVQSLHFSGTRPSAVQSILPEIDQLMVGFTLASVTDPLLTHTQAARLKTVTREIYHELDRDAEFRALDSQIVSAVLDASAAEHAFLYVPNTPAPDAPRRVLLFLHGSGGNFKAYLWLLARVAERRNMVLLAPSHGFGSWPSHETAGVVQRALAAAHARTPLDLNGVHVVGLSNGGRGVCHLLATPSARFRSFALISPVFDFSGIAPRRAASGLARVFVLTGALDDRVPLSYVENAARELGRLGCTVTAETLVDADHFLFFTHHDRWRDALEHWLAANDAP